MHILVVEDEQRLTYLLRRVLMEEGHTVDLAHDGHTGLQLALNDTYSIVILDVLLPGLDGLEVCRQMRAEHIMTPVLMLTARGAVEDRVMGLNVGADDYLIKPFAMNELLARINTLLRRRNHRFDETIQSCVGQQLGNYRLIRLLGQGGFAKVHLGEHVHLGTQVAIKVLRAQLDEQKFYAEAQTIARLAHPRIVRLLDFGVEGNVPFMVMDYAPGGTLKDRHPKGTQLPLSTIVSYIKQIAEALQYAHNEKLIHRDVKPANMLVGRLNDILLSDFGIAIIAHSTRSQKTEDFIGTVAYMAPEQFQGKPRLASDQYALGVVVYEWLSGERPFQGSVLEIATQHMLASPPPLSKKNPSIPIEVEKVVQRALAKDSKRRFASTQAFSVALEQACQAELGENRELLGTPSSGERLAPHSIGHASEDQRESIYWTRLATSSTIQQGV